MSDAGQITVELVAKIDELNAGLGQAVSSIQNATGQMRQAFGQTGQSGKDMDGLLKGVLAGGAFLEFQAIAKEALGAVQEAFEQTTGKAEEFGLSNAKFAAMLGTTETQAAGLKAALQGVGVSSEQYEGMAMRLEMRLKQQEHAWNNYGMATRDAGGQLLTGQGLMESAITTMEGYKTGTDQNEFALQVFGRRAADVYDIMRVSKAAQDQYIQDMKDLGVQVDGTGQSSQALEEELARQKQQWEDLELAIGQKLMPVVTQFLHWMNNDGKPILHGVGVTLEFVADIVVALGVVFLETGYAIGGAVAEVIDIVGHFLIVLKDLITLNWGNLKQDFADAMSDMSSTFEKTVNRMKSIAQGGQSIIDALAGKGPKEPGGNPYDKGGAKGFVADDGGKGAEAARKMADEQLKSAEQVALERVKIEQDMNNHLLAMGQETLDEFVAKQEQLENESYNIKLKFLEKKAEADARDKLAHMKDLDDIKVLTEQHEQAIDRIKEQAAEKRMQLDKQETQNFIADENDRLTNAMASLEEEYKANLLTDGEKAAAERNLTVSIYGEELARLDAELSTLKQGTEAWNAAYRQRQKIAEDMAKAVTKIDNDLANSERQKWTTLSQSIRSSFNQAINGMILGTMTWQKALGTIIDGVATAFLDMGEKILEDWIMVQIEKALIGKSSEAASATSAIAANAAVAGSGAFAATAAIPYVGPALAPGAGAAAYAGALSYEGLAFAEQGMLLDRDRMVFAHKDEQILPSHISKGLQGLIAGGQKGGDVNLHYNPEVNAPQHRSLDQMLTDESSTMLTWLQARVRDGSLKTR